MNLSETIIKIYNLATIRAGELEADELVSSLLVVILNDLKKNRELSGDNLAFSFEKKWEMIERAHLDFETKRPNLSLVEDSSQD